MQYSYCQNVIAGSLLHEYVWVNVFDHRCKKLRQGFIRNSSPLGNKVGMRARDAKQHGGIVTLRKESSERYSGSPVNLCKMHQSQGVRIGHHDKGKPVVRRWRKALGATYGERQPSCRTGRRSNKELRP